MVGVVVADEAHLAQDRVPGSSGDPRQQVRGGIGHEIVERRPVGSEPLDRARELLRRRGGVVGMAQYCMGGIKLPEADGSPASASGALERETGRLPCGDAVDHVRRARESRAWSVAAARLGE